ncbi:MAG: 1-acyl-sn-glycerol-3-phosphate acyltransferase [Candidatus Omnitrophica bacterium]|nr:1-acyl-sn-glycerol-3-phosphate acyltransferase [Candidatus Omnitrophota bacterium]
MFYWLAVFISIVFFKIFSRLEIEGFALNKEKIPFILASNHLSNLDPPLLATLIRQKIHFVAKKELFENKFFGYCLKKLQAMPVDREKVSPSSMRNYLKALKSGPLLIFPQGTRGGSFDSSLSGVGFLAKKAKIPVIAVRISGTDKILPKGAKFPKRGQIKVIFKKVDNISDKDTARDITAKVVEAIKEL